jgi:hypothetical protein
MMGVLDSIDTIAAQLFLFVCPTRSRNSMTAKPWQHLLHLLGSHPSAVAGLLLLLLLLFLTELRRVTCEDVPSTTTCTPLLTHPAAAAAAAAFIPNRAAMR